MLTNVLSVLMQLVNDLKKRNNLYSLRPLLCDLVDSVTYANAQF